MPSVFSFTVRSDATLMGLGAVLSRLRDLTPFWRDVFAPRYFGEVQDTFALEGQSRGEGGQFGAGHWTPLSQAYRAWKNRHFPGQPILQREGVLRDSLAWNGGGLGPGGVFLPSPTAVVVGTDVPYAKYHQRGTATIPARPFLHTPDTRTYGALLREWILNGGDQP